jgi:hypothetical protein
VISKHYPLIFAFPEWALFSFGRGNADRAFESSEGTRMIIFGAFSRVLSKGHAMCQAIAFTILACQTLNRPSYVPVCLNACFEAIGVANVHGRHHVLHEIGHSFLFLKAVRCMKTALVLLLYSDDLPV